MMGTTTMHGAELQARVLHLLSQEDALDALKAVEVDPYGIQVMLPKMVHLNILLEGVECKVANIIKQEMLSLGADAAVARDAVGCSISRTDVILMGTLKQIRRFIEKMAEQPFGLKGIFEPIREILDNLSLNSALLRTSRREIKVGEKTLIMGIINMTPDSFFDGGRFTTPEMAVEEGVRMVEDGADMIDIGGESSRPGSDPIPEEEELRRVIPIVRGLAGKISVPLSVDTMKAPVARTALAEGAEIVNDISSMNYDNQMMKVVAESGAAVILMHMRGMPKIMQTGDLTYRSLRGEVISFLKERIDTAVKRGIAPAQIMVDPGLGFGKSAMDNVRLIRHLRELTLFGRPIVVGPSRKSFIGHVTGGTPQERIEGTAAAVTAAIMNGSRVIRVHDVKTMKKVAAMADALVSA
ncbi:MAG: dihydropteroate synthase [Syntrophus sp. (in: bacteria)]|nr:dihydropteroate synthase [Syntrophus sp. (in: bacteria)]